MYRPPRFHSATLRPQGSKEMVAFPRHRMACCEALPLRNSTVRQFLISLSDLKVLRMLLRRVWMNVGRRLALDRSPPLLSTLNCPRQRDIRCQFTKMTVQRMLVAYPFGVWFRHLRNESHRCQIDLLHWMIFVLTHQ